MLFLLVKNNKTTKLLGAIFSVIVISMLCSRLLLSAHWLTDILGGIFWGFSCLSFNAALIQGVDISSLIKKKLLVISIISIIILWIAHLLVNHQIATQAYNVPAYDNIAQKI